jgi:hypothetical protein
MSALDAVERALRVVSAAWIQAFDDPGCTLEE